jgi:cell division protein ZapA (FtsZ GTPase activity inhibitor)
MSATNVTVTINGKFYELTPGVHTVADIKKKAAIHATDRLDQDVNNVLTPLQQDGAVTIVGGEVFVSFPAEVHIVVDGKEYKIKRGPELVSTIKRIANVPAAYQLDQDINGVLTPLDQNGSVTINGGEVFVGFPATGSSS